MTFSWTPHRFSGGALALDVANSVVLRADPERRIDRFAEPAVMDAFAAGANRHGAERNLFGALEFSLAAAEAGVQPIIGAILAVAREVSGPARPGQAATDQLVLLAKDEAGYQNLSALVSRAFSGKILTAVSQMFLLRKVILLHVDVSSRCRRPDPIIQCHQKRRLRTTARSAHATDFLVTIYFRSGK